MIKTTTKEHDDMTRHALTALAERGITSPTTELLRLELMNQHLAEAGGLAAMLGLGRVAASLEHAAEAGRRLRRLVEHAHGFNTTDSGDGVTKSAQIITPAKWIALGANAHRFARAKLAELLADAGRVLGGYVDTSTGASVIVYADDSGAHAVTVTDAASAHVIIGSRNKADRERAAAGHRDPAEWRQWRVDAFARGDVELAAIVLRDFGRELVLPVSPTTN